MAGVRRVLVTGSSGTIGTRLCERLLAEGYRVAGADRIPNPWSTAVDRVTIPADLRKPGALRAATGPFDLVIHLAAHARVYELVKKPGLAGENMQMLFHALEHARRAGIRGFLFASSREVYGNTSREQWSEEDARIGDCESPYAASKLAGEALVHSYRRCYGMETVIMRFSNVYGMYDGSDRVVPRFLRQARAGKPLTVYGRDKMLDFTYIDDTVSGILAAVERLPDVDGETFNLASGTGTSLLDVAGMIRDAVGSRSRILVRENRPGEVVRFVADIRKARARLGYSPSVGIREGLGRAVRWYADHPDPGPGTKG